jgi:hypothetical protein
MMRGLEHVAVPADQHESQLENFDDGTGWEGFTMDRAYAIAFCEGVMFIRHETAYELFLMGCQRPYLGDSNHLSPLRTISHASAFPKYVSRRFTRAAVPSSIRTCG